MPSYYAKSRLSENIVETPEGYLLCLNVPIARTGEQVYAAAEVPVEPDDEGKVIVIREPDEVFSEKTMASFNGKSFTIYHPDEFVDPKNWKELTSGIAQNIRRGQGDASGDLLADILVTDSKAISLVKSGMREISCGYECEYIELGKGRGKQVNIIGNHVALVDEGRAGPRYAITDHKGAVTMTSKEIKAKFLSVFQKTLDEAMPEKAGDSEAAPTVISGDDIMKAVKDLGEKVAAMGGKAEPKKKEGEDEDTITDEDVNPAVEGRLKALEDKLEMLLEKMSSTGDEGEVIEEGDEDIMTDEDMEEGEDEEMDPKKKVGDTKSRAEILAPGIKMTKDVKVQALKKCYATKDGKKAIHSLTGNKVPSFDNSLVVDMLFNATAELLKESRTDQLVETKRTKDYAIDIFSQPGGMTADKMNEMNAKHYARK